MSIARAIVSRIRIAIDDGISNFFFFIGDLLFFIKNPPFLENDYSSLLEFPLVYTENL